MTRTQPDPDRGPTPAAQPRAARRPRDLRGLSGLCRLAHAERSAGAHAHERGTVLIEALVFMAVIAITVAAFTLSAVTVNQTQRDHHGIDIATQAAHGQLERAKTIPWRHLGFLATDDGYRDTDAQGRATVTLETDTEHRLTPLRTVDVKGLAVTLRTDITWADGHPAGGATGTKQLTVTASWTRDGVAHQMAYTTARSATRDEVAPTAAADGSPLPVGFGPRPSYTPTPTVAPKPTATPIVIDENDQMD